MHLNIPSLPGVRTRDLAILSTLNNTIGTCNEQLQGYFFGNVANALHYFFLYDLCDVYLELIKPVISIKESDNCSTEAKDMQYAAQCTLYTCLEQFLRLAHPLMPFVTEELWQRLPNRTALTSVPSIMVANYPQKVSAWENTAALTDMEVLKSCIHSARSLRTEYKIPNHVKPDFYFRTEHAATKDGLSAQQGDFCTLAKANMLKHLAATEENPNKNVCVKVINDNLSLLVDLTGLINIDLELSRLNKEKARLEHISAKCLFQTMRIKSPRRFKH